MRSMTAALAILALLSYSKVSPAQSFEQYGTWQYVHGDLAEAAYTESTDSNRTFSVGVRCEDGAPIVEIEFLLASPGDDIGLDPDQFAPDGSVAISIGVNSAHRDTVQFSTYSEKFVHQESKAFLSQLSGADIMTLEARRASGSVVGTYAFDLQGVDRVLDALSCYAEK